LKQKKRIKMLYKTEHKETQRKQKISKSPSKKWSFKSHDVPTAQGLLWFRENRVWNKTAFWELRGNCSEATLATLGRFWCHCWRPSDFEGGPKIDHFFKNLKNEKNKRSKKRLWKNMICWSIFDAKMRGLKWYKRGFRIIRVANYKI
jgi:hypothetical protein